ncbi:MAG: isoprenyl transferase [Parvibaculales bacterium]
MSSATASDTPAHIAIIMDGNGRWAEQCGMTRREGHRKGVETLRQMVRDVGELGIKYLTVFSFSTQNWGRPKPEVDFLMTLLERYIESDLAELHSEGVRIRVIGRRDGLSDKICKLIDRAETLTSENSNMYLQIAFNYGGREELADAAARLARRAVAGTLDSASITPEVMASEMLTAGMPDPDLIIRTSGEYRISNFLLWQSAYSEFYFTDILWPDFTRDDLQEALHYYAERERRFGLVSAQVGDTD